MTSRERLLKALAIEEADRVPISCYEMVGWDLDNWYNHQSSYRDLMQLVRDRTDCIYMGHLPGRMPGKLPDRVLVEKGEGAEKWRDCVTIDRWREGKSEFVRTTYHTPRGELTQLDRRDDDVFTTWTLEHPLKTIEDIDKYLSIEWELGDMDLNEFAADQRNLGEHGIMMASLPDPICVAAELYEMGQYLVHAVTQTKRIKYLMDVIHERHMLRLRTVMDAGTQAGVNWSEVMFRICGPEYATPPYLSPEFFALLVTPYVKEMSDVMHEHGAKMRLHCHGRIGRVLNEIMKTDPDAIDPIEPPPDGDVPLGEVKKRIGDRVCLLGNLELKLLEHGKAEEVRQFVIDAMVQAKPGGGYVIMPTSSPINIPLSKKTEENYRIFIETALEYGEY